ncbi:hypothetical protein [Saccharopolyspora spinosa]|uniref:Uncharacterized protein n=1 Tax=Saccharopolyspora spinosa TaxID=60894 RepID=A0A2N3Y471_SACSN|nr:hypothetical protein [Saccharopolyspora spinosa]PKW17621.1 hypothetical protein A8926_5607 [Saccharopolyspora spinosa]
MTSAPSPGADRAEVEAARLVLERMGVSPQDLLGTTSPRPAAPTFADYIPQVAAAVSEGTRRVYSSYWNRIVDQWGHRRLDEPTSSEIWLSRPGARCRDCSRSVSPGRSPNPPCRSLGNGLSTVSVVRRGQA